MNIGKIVGTPGPYLTPISPINARVGSTLPKTMQSLDIKQKTGKSLGTGYSKIRV